MAGPRKSKRGKSDSATQQEGALQVFEDTDDASTIKLPDVELQICQICKISVVNSVDFMKCDGCSGVFHLSCSDFNIEVFTVLKEQNCFGDIMWHCTQCKAGGTKVYPSQEDTAEMINLIKALQIRVTKLEDNNSILNQVKQFPSLKATSVDAATTAVTEQTTNQVESHQVFVIPKENEKLTKESMCEIARRNLNNIPIKKVGITKQGHGFIKVPNKQNCDDVLTTLKSNYNAVAKSGDIREFLPKITISDINTADYSNKNKEDLKSAILNKNPTIKACVDEDKSFEILFLTQDKSNNSSKAIVRIHPDILSAIKHLRYRIYLDFATCRVNDRFFVKQCYRCQKFGHRNDDCPLKQYKKHVCRYCSDDHDSSTCSLRRSKSCNNLKCANCSGAHSTTDASCTVLQKQLQYIISRTKGLEDFPKNSIPRHAIVT